MILRVGGHKGESREIQKVSRLLVRGGTTSCFCPVVPKSKMAAKVANSAQGSNDRDEGPGVSYASVLNPTRTSEVAGSRPALSTKDNNKENIGQVGPSPATAGAKERIASHSQNVPTKGKSYQKNSRRFNAFPPAKSDRRSYYANTTEVGGKIAHDTTDTLLKQKDPTTPVRTQKSGTEHLNGDVGSDGEFQTVAPKSARRKEKLHKDHRDHQPHRERHRHHDRHTQPQRGHSAGGSKDRVHKEKVERYPADHLLGSKDVCLETEETEVDGNGEPVKYVEAPLPVVNPWTKSKSQSADSAPQLQPPQQRQTVAPEAPTATVPIPTAAPVAVAVVTRAPPAAVLAPVLVPTPVVVPVAKAEKPVQVQNGREKRVLQPQQQQGKIGKFGFF